MLGSITPLGERGRGSRWGITATAHVLGATIGGLAIGASLGLLGEAPSRALGADGRLDLLAVSAMAGVALDVGVGGLGLPTVLRQVNEDWMTRYRGWVYGLGFGVQLGLGVVTVVTTSAVYVSFVAAFLSGGVRAGGLVGGAFGLARGVMLLGGVKVSRPEHLARVHLLLRRWDHRSRIAALFAQAGLAAAIVAGALR